MIIVREDGQRGKVVKRKAQKGLPAELILEFEDGSQLAITEDHLEIQEDGNARLLLNRPSLAKVHRIELEVDKDLVIPVAVEELVVEKRRVETAKVRFNTRVEKREEVVDEPLLHEQVSVERVVIDREIQGAVPTTREENGVLIIPIIEEVLVVTKVLRLKEELHVTRHRSQVSKPQRLELRREIIDVVRIANNQTQEVPVSVSVSVSVSQTVSDQPTSKVETEVPPKPKKKPKK